MVRIEVKGRQVGDEDKGNGVGGQIIGKPKLSGLSPAPSSMLLHFLFSKYFLLYVISRHPARDSFMCVTL